MSTRRTENVRPIRPPQTGEQGIDEIIVELLVERDRIEQEIAGMILADPSLVAILRGNSPRGTETIERRDLRIMVQAAAERRERVSATALSLQRLQHEGLRDDKIHPHYRGSCFWSMASLVDLVAESIPFQFVVEANVARLVEIDNAMRDARDAITFAKDRLRGAL